MSEKTFCGRKLNPLTMTYDTADGESKYPIEMQQDVMSTLHLGRMVGCPAIALGELFAWKDRLSASRPTTADKEEGKA